MPRAVAKKAPAKKAPAKKAPAKKADPEPTPGDSNVGLRARGAQLSSISDSLNILWSGEQGTGKTSNAVTMANSGPIVVINAEGGLKKGPLQRLGINIDNIFVFPPDPNDLTFEFLEDLYWDLSKDLEEDPDSWAGVIWDSITEIHMKLLQNVVDYEVQKAIKQGRSRIKDTQPTDPVNRTFVDISDYGVMTSQMRRLLRMYRDLPCHFGITSLLTRDLDDDGRVVYRPQITPALRNDLMGYVDVVSVCGVTDDDGQEQYQGLHRPIGKHRGKDRFGVLPRVMVNPTFERILALTQGADIDQFDVVQDSDPVQVAND